MKSLHLGLSKMVDEHHIWYQLTGEHMMSSHGAAGFFGAYIRTNPCDFVWLIVE